MTSNSIRGGRAGAACFLLAVAFLVAGIAHAQKGKDGEKLTFEVYKDKGGEFRWRLRTASEKVLAVPEDAYKSHESAREAADNVRKSAANPKWKVEYYQDKAKEYRWRLKAANGHVMARSPGGFKNKKEAEHAFDVVRRTATAATITDKK
jgi:uncharacterized protein YegP (UPF0339 family)